MFGQIFGKHSQTSRMFVKDQSKHQYFQAKFYHFFLRTFHQTFNKNWRFGENLEFHSFLLDCSLEKIEHLPKIRTFWVFKSSKARRTLLMSLLILAIQLKLIEILINIYINFSCITCYIITNKTVLYCKQHSSRAHLDTSNLRLTTERKVVEKSSNGFIQI